MSIASPIRDRPAEPPDPAAAQRLRRLRWLAWVLDGSIPLGPWRIGIDPLLGLIPGLGDWLGAAASGYIVYEAARLGVPGTVLLRMTGNILIETLIGVVPVVGDAFDFAWKANLRNIDLIDQHYRGALSARPVGARPAGKMGLAVGGVLLAALLLFAGLLWGLIKLATVLLH